jgi:hypothetical protein
MSVGTLALDRSHFHFDVWPYWVLFDPCYVRNSRTDRHSRIHFHCGLNTRILRYVVFLIFSNYGCYSYCYCRRHHHHRQYRRRCIGHVKLAAALLSCRNVWVKDKMAFPFQFWKLCPVGNSFLTEYKMDICITCHSIRPFINKKKKKEDTTKPVTPLAVRKQASNFADERVTPSLSISMNRAPRYI